MRRDYINPKRKIRKHLQKRKTSFNSLYVVFIFAIVAVGTISMLLRSDFQSEASAPADEMVITENYNESFIAEIEAEEAIIIPDTIELAEENTLFPRTTKESLLREMVEKEGLDLTAQEEMFFETH